MTRIFRLTYKQGTTAGLATGYMMYRWMCLDAGAVSGYTNPVDQTGTTFAQTGIINTSDTVQWIDYTFVPRINNPRPGNLGCEDGVDTTIRIWLNPRPKVAVSLSPYDTICFDQDISFNIDSITRGTTGQWVYSVEVQVSDLTCCKRIHRTGKHLLSGF